MKTIKLLPLLVLCLLMGCVNENNFDPSIISDEEDDGPFTNLNVAADFDFATTKEVTLELDVPPNLRSAVFSVYSKTGVSDSTAIGKGTFDDMGHFEKNYVLSSRTDSLLVYTNYVGLLDNLRLGVQGSNISFDYRPYYSRSSSSGKRNSKNISKNQISKADNYEFIDTFDSFGLPDNLAFSDVISQNLLDDINASLPENVSGGVPVSNPDFLAGKETSLIITKEADVWVTFVSEGAGYRNVLGYYTHPIGEEPVSVDEIDPHYVIFPNVSMQFSGGSLIPGDRVYLGRFPENTVVSWFLVANGWNWGSINQNSNVYYSNPDFNPESTPEKRNHMVLLYDEGRELTLLGFEDLFRDGPTDDDFNDAVFYAKSNPVDAIQVGNLATIKPATDADGDGINDELDDFPFDPNKAFNNFSPSVNSNGKLVYEDLWPSQGDYDFNDLDLDYSFNLIANADNAITSIDASFTIEGIGGSLQNGFGFVLPIGTDLIESISGQVLNGGYEDVGVNGTENGTEPNESVVLVVGNASELLGQTIDVKVTLASPQTTDDLGSIPFNTFLIVNRDRAREVHLPDMPPTSKAEYLGTKDDFSDPSLGRYYKTKTNLPWAMNIYDGFETPPESVPITLQYPRFINWANSGGTQDLDWFLR